jgi:hypothetical protein
MNQVGIEVYSTDTTRLPDPGDELRRASGVNYSTGFPGGRYLEGSFFIPRDVIKSLLIQGDQRVVIRNGQDVVYEGWIDSFESQLDETSQGVEVQLIGAWGRYAMRRYMRKRWADTRLTDDVWTYVKDASGADLCTIDRQGRLRFVPKAEAWTNGNGAAVQFTMPAGETVKRITYDYDLQEGGQAWEISAYRSEDDVSYTVMNEANGDTIAGAGTTSVVAATGTGSMDIQLGTASRYVRLLFYARADQTPTSDGTYYGEFTNVTVYSELGSINLTEISKDIRAHFSEINDDETRITSNTLSLVPFIYDRWTPWADIITDACSFGDSSFNRWGAGMLASELAATPNGEPVMTVAVYTALTDYDYAIRLKEENVIGSISLKRDFSQIYNYIIVEYTDELGDLQQIMPEDSGYGNLDDAASIAAYGGRAYVLNVGSSTAAAAYNSGQRFLAAYKDPQWVMQLPITVRGYIRAKEGYPIPACRIQAGYRLKIEDFIEDVIFRVSHTDYDDDSQTCTISAGPPGDLVFPRYIFADPIPEDDGMTTSVSTGGGGSGGGEVERLNWKRRIGLTPGTPEWDKASKGNWADKRAMLEEWRNKRKRRG